MVYRNLIFCFIKDVQLSKLIAEMETFELKDVSSNAWHDRTHVLQQYIQIYRDFMCNPGSTYNVYKYFGTIPEEVYVFSSGFAWNGKWNAHFCGGNTPLGI